MNNKRVTIICLVLAAIVLIIICANKFINKETASSIIPDGCSKNDDITQNADNRKC